jgi:hypothetical protein
VEHDHPRRSPGQPEQHLQRPVAARELAAAEPDHRPGHGGRGAVRGGRRSDGGGQLQFSALQYEGQHAAPHVDA